MEEREQEEGSSSQNVNIITEIKERGAFIEIVLSSGSSFFVFPEDFTQLGLLQGCGIHRHSDESQNLSEELLEKIKGFNNISAAYKKAVSILSFAPTTAFLLKQKLLKKGFDNVSIGKTIERLSEKTIIDDKKFAAGWVSLRLSKNPQSPFILKSALIKKGVNRAIIEEVLKDFTPNSSLYMESFEKALSKQLRKTSRPIEKVKVSLLRKGYPISLINKYLENR
jgi:SOS response regulatory protein OraA/RecX